MDITEIASQFFMAHNMGQIKAAQLAAILYEEVTPRRQGGKALIRLSPKDCQCVGLAFTAAALYYSFGNEDINSVAAENAYYCLTKNLVETGNTFVAPAIYTLMEKGGRLMDDKLISSWCDMAQKEAGMPIGMMLGGNPFHDPRLKDFRVQAINFKDNIAYYALLKFYNIEKQQYVIPTDLPYFIPDQSEIKSFLARIRETPSFRNDSFVADCERHFISVYKQCEDTLMQY